MRRRWLLLLTPAALSAPLGACAGDEEARPAKDAGGDVVAPVDAGAPAVVATFDAAAGEHPVGILVEPGGPIVGLAPLGRLVKVLPDGGRVDVASFSGASGGATAGLARGAAGEIYVAVGADGPAPVPAPGVYRIEADGGAPLPWGEGPLYRSPNDPELIGGDLYVSDSSGKILVVELEDGGAATRIWADGEELRGDRSRCGLPGAIDIGARGIAYDDDYLYGVNHDRGTFFRIERRHVVDGGPDGGVPGRVEVLFRSCDFAGADGVVRDEDGTFLVANRERSRIDRVSVGEEGATYVTVARGTPLDAPSGLLLEGGDGGRTLWITSSALGSAAPKPALLTLPLR